MQQHDRLRCGLAAALLGMVGFVSLPVRGESVSTPPAKVPEARAKSPADPQAADYQRWHTNEPGEYAGYNQRATLIQRGKEVYATYCIGCHGENGDGKGPAAKRLITQPRDFTKGIFKFRSTDSSSLPLDSDLHRTITRGLSRVSMPGFPLMPEREKLEVIEYVKSFYPEWEAKKDSRIVIAVPKAPADLGEKERVGRGHFVYLAAGCNKCHGTDGQGAGATLTEYVDAWGNKQKPFNFTRGRLKGGDDPEDIYRTFHTGLRSVMPSFGGPNLAAPSQETIHNLEATIPPADAAAIKPYAGQFPEKTADVFGKLDETQRRELIERNSWDLVAFILSLRNNTTTVAAVLGVQATAAPNGEPSR